MSKLTELQLGRQDHVDNRIFELLGDLLPPGKEPEWDIEMIGEIRDAIREQVVEKKKLVGDAEFYPYTDTR